MKPLKKVLTGLLVLSMVMSFISVPAFAEDGAGNADPELPEAASWPLLEGSKSAELVDRSENSYKVTVQVPGGEGIQKYDEVIIMVDGSYSMDGDWKYMKEALLQIGDTVLNGNGNTRLSLMAFGMSPNVVMESVESVAEMEANLPSLPGGLLYGRSSTNCHGAFMGLREYVDGLYEEAGEELNHVYVLFLSDGQVNQHSCPIDWYSYAKKIPAGRAATAHVCELDAIVYGGFEPSPYTVEAFGDVWEETLNAYTAAYAGMDAYIAAGGNYNDVNNGSKVNNMIKNLEGKKTEAEAVLADTPAAIAAAEAELAGLIAALPEGENPEANEAVQAKKSEIATLQAKLSKAQTDLPVITAKLDGLKAFSENTAVYTKCQNEPSDADPALTRSQYYVHLAWEDFYANTGFEKETAEPIYVMETAFLKYQEALGKYYFEDAFYLTAITAPINNGSLNGPCAAEEAAALAEEIDGLYMIRYGWGGSSGWMETIAGSKFIQSTSISTLTAALEEVLGELAKTPYNDVVITDYMSKWVNLQPETIQVLDRSGSVVAAFDAENSDVENGIYQYKWTGTPLCEGKAPIVLEKIAPEDYAAGGDDVVGNISGDIYRITWNVKDGPLYRADSYRMEYQVTVDTREWGFMHNTSYPANGNTGLEYTDEQGNPKDNDIEVPEVDVPRTPRPFVPEEDEEETVSVSAEKVWVGDSEATRPETITVQLLKNGTAEEEAVLSAENNWSCTWDELEEGESWTVTEAAVPEGYTSAVVQTGTKFTITNTYQAEPEKEPPLEDVDDPDVPKGGREEEDPLYDLGEDGVPKDGIELGDPDIPKTSDNTNLLLWMTIAFLSAAALAAVRTAERKIR